ncbi:MAG: hypothetical protein ACQGVC_13990 [Myxococcota bacterium]
MKTNRRENRREEGVTLLITVIMILLVGILVLTSIGHSGDESVAGARARSTARALHAADGGMQLALTRVTQNPPNTGPIDVTVDGISVQSRTRADATPQNLDSLGSGPPPEGYGINAGSGYVAELFRVDITSSGPTGSTAELQSKLYRFDGAAGGY